MPSPNPGERERFSLTEEQKTHFLDYGFVKLENCFSREAAAEFTESKWTRLGVSPDDSSTWPTGKISIAGHSIISIEEFAPKAWDGIVELLGGEDRLAEWCKVWGDGLIFNFGHPDFKATDTIDFRALGDWHNDGTWFTHFLDSPEQALLVTPLYSDIEPKCGGTAICTDGIGLIARHMVRSLVL
jgi:hypothetical protein